MIKIAEDHVDSQQKMVAYVDDVTNIKMERGFVAALAQQVHQEKIFRTGMNKLGAMIVKFNNNASWVPGELHVTIEATSNARGTLNEAQEKICNIPFPWVEGVEGESAPGSEAGASESIIAAAAKMDTGDGDRFSPDEGNTVNLSSVTEDAEILNADKGLKRKSENIVIEEADEQRSFSDGLHASTTTGDPPGRGGSSQ